jgi:predicted nucleic acid-binding protein
VGPPGVKYLIDTNVWIDAIIGRLHTDTFLRLTVQAEWVGYSAITRLELFGFPGLTTDEEQKISSLLKNFSEVGIDSKTIDQAVMIRKAVRIKIPDAIIAASAILAESSLLTRNTEDFKGISALTLVNPYKA